MNYGFPPTRFDAALAERIKEYAQKLEPDARGMHPYVEISGPYDGVRLRRITHYSNSRINTIIKNLESIYKEVEADHVD